MRRIAIVIVGVMIVAAGCQSATEKLSEQIAEQATGVDDVDINTDTGEVSIKTDEGDITIGGGELPEGFDIPLPDGYQILSVFSAGDQSSVALQYDGGRYDELVAFFADWVEGQPGEWNSSSSTVETANGETMRFAGWSTDAQQVNVSDCSSVDSSGDTLDATCVTVADF